MDDEPPKKVRFLIGYRKYTEKDGFYVYPASKITADTISHEEVVLEALRDRFKNDTDQRLRCLPAIAYKAGRIGGQGVFYLLITNGRLEPDIHMEAFAQLLGVNKMNIDTAGTEDEKDLVLILPEAETVRALDIPAPSRSQE